MWTNSSISIKFRILWNSCMKKISTPFHSINWSMLLPQQAYVRKHHNRKFNTHYDNTSSTFLFNAFVCAHLIGENWFEWMLNIHIKTEYMVLFNCYNQITWLWFIHKKWNSRHTYGVPGIMVVVVFGCEPQLSQGVGELSH